MKVLLVTAAPERAAADPDSPAAALRDLGCNVRSSGFDLGFDEEDLSRDPPAVLVIDARDRLLLGYAALKQLREQAALANLPALIAVTTDKVTALDFRGADDFVLVPVVPAELYARLRQLDWRFAAFAGAERIKVGDLDIDLAGYEAFVRDRRLELTHQEFELLRFLAQHPGKVWTREQLLTKVWGYEYAGGTRTVDIHVRRLRAKLGPPAGEMIETLRHVGYKLVDPLARAR